MIRVRGGGGLLRSGRCAPYAAQPAPTPRISYPRGLFYWSQTGDISIGARHVGTRGGAEPGRSPKGIEFPVVLGGAGA